MTITEYLGSQSKSVLNTLGMLLFVLVATGDYLTHTNHLLNFSPFYVNFSPFYVVPVSFFGWFTGKRAGIAMAVLSVCLAFVVRLRYIPRAIAYWDALVWLALYVSSALMIAQFRRLYDHERYLSRIDPLTRIENRRALLEAAARAKSFSDRQQTPLSIAYLDLDGFKQLNDYLGHASGDQVLLVTATTIRNVVRPTDVVARIGGDEFAILIPGTDTDTAARIMYRVRSELVRAMQDRGWQVTCSIGLASFSPPVASVDDMLRAADQTMYAAKNMGKNRLEQREIAA
jgi:diguanylate cyclase (GGDEF)-like protein